MFFWRNDSGLDRPVVRRIPTRVETTPRNHQEDETQAPTSDRTESEIESSSSATRFLEYRGTRRGGVITIASATAVVVTAAVADSRRRRLRQNAGRNRNATSVQPGLRPARAFDERALTARGQRTDQDRLPPPGRNCSPRFAASSSPYLTRLSNFSAGDPADDFLHLASPPEASA